LLGNAAPRTCRRGALEITSLSLYHKYRFLLQCDDMLRCSFARAANISATPCRTTSPAPHEARRVEHVFGNAIICKNQCV
jgi:hypothetical protein